MRQRGISLFRFLLPVQIALLSSHQILPHPLPTPHVLKSEISLSLPTDMLTLLPSTTSVDMIKLLSFGLSLRTNAFALMVIPLPSWIPPPFTLLFCTNYLTSCTSFILIRAEIRGLGIGLTLKINWPAADVPQISEDVIRATD